MTLAEQNADGRKMLMAFCAGAVTITVLRIGLSILDRLPPAAIDVGGLAVSLGILLGLVSIGPTWPGVRRR